MLLNRGNHRSHFCRFDGGPTQGPFGRYFGREPASAPKSDFESKVESIRKEIREACKSFKPEGFDPVRQVMEWGMRDMHTKLQLLHFIDALPRLTLRGIVSNLREYFPHSDRLLPVEIRALSAIGSLFGSVPVVGPAVVGCATRYAVKQVAARFTSPNSSELLRIIELQQQLGLDHTVDVLGEAVLSEEEAEAYVRTYERMLEDPQLRDRSYRLNNISVKLSSLYSRFDPIDYEGTKEAVKQRLRRIVKKAKLAGVFVNIDMEQNTFKDITIDIFKEMLVEYPDLNKDNFGIAIQAYLTDSGRDIDDLIEFARTKKKTFTVRLVKGAYWEYETATSTRLGWPIPVYTNKKECDRNFEEQARKLLECENVRAAFGTHNQRSSAYVLAMAEDIRQRTGARPDFEFQVLQGMRNDHAQALRKMGYSVRVYSPWGELLPGMAYLVRRILENTSNESCLRAQDDEVEDARGMPAAHLAQAESAPARESHFHAQQVERSHKMRKAAARAEAEVFPDTRNLMMGYADKAESMTRESSSQVISCPGEENRLQYLPRGSGVLVANNLSFNEFAEVLTASLVAGNSVTVAGGMDGRAKQFIQFLGRNGYRRQLSYSKKNVRFLVAEKNVDWVFCKGPESFEINRIAAETSKESKNVKRVIFEVSPDLLYEFFTAKSICENTMRRGFAPELKKTGGILGFVNQPPADFSKSEVRTKMEESLVRVESQFGRIHPLVIGGEERLHDESRLLVSTNPAHPERVVGLTYYASRKDADDAVAAAREALPAWSALSAKERAEYLQNAARIMRERRFDLAALIIYEAGKTWKEAVGDVDEAIDFLNYYPLDGVRLEKEDEMHEGARRVPNGVCAVISPWNFPLAILTGMAAGALAAGNTVVMKPASQTPIIAAKLMEVFSEAGLPTGVANYLPGKGSEIGQYLVEHEGVDTIAFTGSEETGMGIIESAARAERQGRRPKIVIAEMGGKNAIIVDSSADLDVAVASAVQSAFGYGGQKCSADSRVIVPNPIYDEFNERLKNAILSMKISDPSDPSILLMGPLIDEQAKGKVNEYKKIAEEEGLKKLVEFEAKEMPKEGHYVAPTVYIDVPPDSRLAQEEIFGPVLVVMKSSSFEEAVEIANGVKYGLTGGFISRTPSHIDKFKRMANVGNVYINRGVTGALVGRHPFGGDKHSGTGPKAGGIGYIQRFTHWKRA